MGTFAMCLENYWQLPRIKKLRIIQFRLFAPC